MTTAPDPAEVRALTAVEHEHAAQILRDARDGYRKHFPEGHVFSPSDQWAYALIAVRNAFALASATEAPPVAGMGDLESDVARLRMALIEMGRLIPGCALRDEVSTDFLMLLPEEMRLWKEKALTKPTPPASVSGEVVVVPRQPTEAMLETGSQAHSDMLLLTDDGKHDAGEIWSAMLAAAPEAATPSAEHLAVANATPSAEDGEGPVVRSRAIYGECPRHGRFVLGLPCCMDATATEAPSAVGGVDRMREAGE